MNNSKNVLIGLAIHKMKNSHDPIHDFCHVQRVVNYTKKIVPSHNLSDANENILYLATWWHDVGRTITSNPSLIFMTMFDDIISAILLLYFAIKYNKINKITIQAIIVLLSKSYLLKPLFKIILSKNKKIILNILEDADNLDMLTISRTEQIRIIVNTYPAYAIGYKYAIHWFLHIQKIKMQTLAAKKIVIELIHQFIKWLQQPEIFKWHQNIFSTKWINNNITLAKKIHKKIILEIKFN